MTFYFLVKLIVLFYIQKIIIGGRVSGGPTTCMIVFLAYSTSVKFKYDSHGPRLIFGKQIFLPYFSGVFLHFMMQHEESQCPFGPQALTF